MLKVYLIATIIFLIFFIFRVYQIGGLEKQDEFNEFYSFTSQFDETRLYLSAKAEEILPEPQAALLSGMLLGEKSTLPYQFSNALRKTSTIHIVVVSGQNLTLMGGFFLGFASILGRKKAIILAILASLAYALLTGLQIPVIRAFIMFFFASLAQLFNRDRDGIWILLLAAGAMLIFNPNYLLSISFQLSFLATIGVVVVAPEIDKLLKSLKLFNLLRQEFSVSLAAQLMTMPIIAFNFYQISLVGILVNSLILFTVPIIMITGAAALLVSLLSTSLGQIVAIIPGVFLTYFVYIVSFFNQSWGSITTDATSWVVWLGYFLLILAGFLALRSVNSKEVVP
jgi:competence protein ComEC